MTNVKVGGNVDAIDNRMPWRYWMAMTLAFSISISQYLSVWILVLLVIVNIWGRLRVTLKRAWDNLVYVLILIIGLIYSDNLGPGLGAIEKSLSLIAMPLVFAYLFPLSEDKLVRLLVAFLVGMCCSGLISLASATWKFYETGLIDSFKYYELTGFLDFQPTYYAYFLVFSITCGLYLLYYEKSPIKPQGMVIFVLFLFFILLLTGGRTSFISMLLVCTFFILKFLLEAGQGWQRTTFGMVALMIFGLFVTTSWVGDTTMYNDSWDRYDLWMSAIRANTDVFWGVGTGDLEPVLNRHFMNNGMERYASENLNAHNQFIQTYLSNGALGLVAVLLMISRPLYLAFRQDNTLPILALFPFIIYGMTEVFLGRYQGVVFFAFLHQIFISHLLAFGTRPYKSQAI